MNFDLIKGYAFNLGLALILLVLLLLGLVLVDRLIKRFKTHLLSKNFKSLRIFSLEIINVGKQKLIITTAINAIQIAVSISFLYISLVVILSQISTTESIADELIDLIFIPLQVIFNSAVNYLPDLFNIVITILVARYLIKAVKYITDGVIDKSFQFPGFEPRTARTTGRIITFLISIITVIMILPSMPGYESLAFKGIATFMGILITIGGSSVIANYMAGIVITYMHAFDKGDWVEIDGVSGQIVTSGTYAIRLNSYKGEAINIPNSKALGSVIRNFSGKNQRKLIIHTEVSIGYDVPWKRVNTLLIQAAKLTQQLDEKEDPFVLQKKLDDFYIVYELNAVLNNPAEKPKAYSALHSNILDVFNNEGIEIMSPHYRAERDGTQTTVTKKS